jgi:CDP-diacylglycerol pyrophosphatase
VRFLSFRHTRLFFLCFVLALCNSNAGAEPAQPRPRDVLWHIVSICIDIHQADYCTRCFSPRTDSSCGSHRACDDTTEIWKEDSDYVAIRDIKMCGCGKNFVHGLAMPRSPVTGVEDPRRPEGIWNFAWMVAKKRIGKESDIALVVNPARRRTQDQLHVHIVKLLPNARRRFTGAASVRVPSLSAVWREAAHTAARAGLKDYGVLVAKLPEGDFLVIVEEKSPEKMYTQGECR